MSSTVSRKLMKEAVECVNDGDLKGASEKYILASEECDGCSAIITCLDKAARCLAETGSFFEATDLFQKIIKLITQSQSDLLKFSYNKFFLSATLSRMASGRSGDPSVKLEIYKKIYPPFSVSRECKFLTDILSAQTLDQYAETIEEHEAISPFSESWITSALLKYKKNFAQVEPAACGVDGPIVMSVTLEDGSKLYGSGHSIEEAYENLNKS